MAQGNFKKSGGAPKVKGKAGRGNVAAKSKRLVNKGKTAVKKGCEFGEDVLPIHVSKMVTYFNSRAPSVTHHKYPADNEEDKHNPAHQVCMQVCGSKSATLIDR